MKYFYYFLATTLLLWSEHNYSNALVHSSSPYLKQHAHNPVNWYPWGKEALAKAKKENKLIFLSIGYSTCHWCHVMEEESFVDTAVAKLLNDNFISIKVDREEYPQIDKKYQQRYMQRYGKRGGWPLSVFLSPAQELFFLGTYIPKEPGYSSQGLINILPSFVALQKSGAALAKEINTYKSQLDTNVLTKKTTRSVDSFVESIAKEYDSTNGGFAKRPKFPEASKLDLLLDIHRLNGNKKSFKMAENTLRKMAQSGLYDQIGGGFFRYTVDETWQTPHFEKMLYTNAELIDVYVKLYEMTGDRLYKKVVNETIAQMEENYLEHGLYLSASDADSDGEEGGYFIYEYVAIKEVLKKENWSLKDIENTLAYMGIEEDGNIDGDFSHTHITSEHQPLRVNELKAYLKSVSAKRIFPFVDKKINTAWSSMMIKALFSASSIDETYLKLAKVRLNTLLFMMRKEDVLYHQTLFENEPTQEALLEDYAFLLDALLEGYSKTYHDTYLVLAKTLTDEALIKFYRNNKWYLSNDGIKALADFDDRYYTSALSLMLENLVRLTSLTGTLTYSDIAKKTIEKQGSILDSNPAYSSKLVHTYLRLKKGDVVIHASRDKLLLAKELLNNVQYPFLLSKTQETDEYLACKTTMCFAHDKNISKLIEQINKAIE